MLTDLLGTIVHVHVDRPLGSVHPEFPYHLYHTNYGYVSGLIAADGEAQNAYVLGVNGALEEFTGRVIAVIHRLDDIEDQLVVAPDGVMLTAAEIRKAVMFQEMYFSTEIEMWVESC